MRIVPRHWHNETWVCSMRGHAVPAAGVGSITAADRRLAVEVGDGTRLCRCLRCDTWIELPDPAETATTETMPALSEMTLPRRGRVLQDAILLRLISISRGLHSIGFALLAIALGVVELKLPGLKRSANSVYDSLQSTITQSGQDPSRRFLAKQASKIGHFNQHTVVVLLVTASVYAVIEGVEAVGLWKERRWAEYLTAVATAGFLPLEIIELVDKVSALRVIALVGQHRDPESGSSGTSTCSDCRAARRRSSSRPRGARSSSGPRPPRDASDNQPQGCGSQRPVWM